MTKYVYFVLLFTTLKVSCQIKTDLLFNEWTLVNNKMLDGSRNLAFNENNVQTWTISNSDICEQNNLQIFKSKNCYNYQLKNNLLQTSEKSNYEVLKLTNDSLIIKQNIKNIESPDKINILFFAKSALVRKKITENVQSDSILIATKYFSPLIDRNIMDDLLSYLIEKDEKSYFDVEGNIEIYPQKKSVILSFAKNDENNKSKKSIEILKQLFENSFKKWDLVYFQSFKKIIIPFKIKRVGKIEIAGHSSISAIFFDNETPSTKKTVKTKNKITSLAQYEKAIEAFNNKKYDKAIELFNKSYEDDNTNIDALYNISSIQFAQNNIKEACIALQTLKDLEQTEGTKMFNEKCRK